MRITRRKYTLSKVHHPCGHSENIIDWVYTREGVTFAYNSSYVWLGVANPYLELELEVTTEVLLYTQSLTAHSIRRGEFPQKGYTITYTYSVLCNHAEKHFQCEFAKPALQLVTPSKVERLHPITPGLYQRQRAHRFDIHIVSALNNCTLCLPYKLDEGVKTSEVESRASSMQLD